MSSEIHSTDQLYALIRAGDHVGQTTTPALAVGGVLWRQHGETVEVYLVHRNPKLDFAAGYWCFPGGKVEAGDRQEERWDIAAFVRELREELGPSLPIDEDKYIRAGQWRTPSFAHRQFEVHLLAHRVEEELGLDPFLTSELCGGEWVSAAQLEERLAKGEWMVEPSARLVAAELGEWKRAGESAQQLELRLHKLAGGFLGRARYWEVAGGVAVCPLRTPTLPPATHTNCYFMGGSEIAVIDPATPEPEEQEVLLTALRDYCAEGRRVAMVILTHHHSDHVAAATRVAKEFGVPVAAHHETAKRLGERVQVTRELVPGEELELGGRTLKVLFTPGHAPGHVCILDTENRFMAAGDMVAGIGTILIDPSEGDMAEYLESLQRMSDEGPRVLLPAHGHVIADPLDRLAQYRKHRLWREEQVMAAVVAQPGTSRELTAVAYRDVPAAIHPLAERSLLAHLGKLADEGRVAKVGEQWRATPD